MTLPKRLITEYKEPDYGLIPNEDPIYLPAAAAEGPQSLLAYRQRFCRVQAFQQDASVLQDPFAYVAYFLASHTCIRHGDVVSIYTLYDRFRDFVPDLATIPNVKRAAFTTVLASWARENNLRCFLKDGDVIAVEGLSDRVEPLTPRETAAFLEGWSCRDVRPACPSSQPNDIWSRS